MDPLLWLACAAIVAVILFSIPYIQNLLFTGVQQQQQQQQRDNNEQVIVGGVRRRPRGVIHDEDDDVDETEISMKKIGTKKRKKLAEKAEKKALREQEQALREDEKQRDAVRQEELKKKEQELEILNQKKEREEKEKREKLEQQKHEEYLKLKSTFVIEDEGDRGDTDDNESLQEFVNYIKTSKVVIMEDIAAQFSMRTQDVIDRINHLQNSGQLTGVIDDRGKFIFITIEELQSVAKFIKQRGRVSISELVQSSNNLINLHQ